MIIKVGNVVIGEASTDLATYRQIIHGVSTDSEKLISELSVFPQLKGNPQARMLLASYVLAAVEAGGFSANTHDGKLAFQALSQLIHEDEMFTWTLPRRPDRAPDVRIDSRENGLATGESLPGALLEDTLLPILRRNLVAFAASSKFKKHRSATRKYRDKTQQMTWSMLYFPPDPNEWAILLSKIHHS